MNPFYNYHKLRQFLLINALIALIISVFFGFNDDIGSSWYKAAWLKTFFLEYFLYAFILSALLSGGINLLIEFSARHFSWLDSPARRLIFDLLVVVSYTFIVTFILTAVFAFYIWNSATINTVDWASLLGSTKFPILVSLGFTFFFTSRSFLYEWREAVIETEQMKTERLAGQYQSLKDQLNPHFLFNSLNVLSNLVYEDADKSSAFVEKLASVYRYVLDVQDERIVYLDRELRFASSYLELQKVRFGEKLQYKINVKSGTNFSIPPLSLQLLLENAVKHNIATSEAPLKIEIQKVGRRLIIKNNLQLRPQAPESSGIGLENIKKRYSYFTNEEVIIRNDNGEFSVSIPLIVAE